MRSRREECRDCAHFNPSDKDAVNSSKCKCSERDNYYYPSEEACSKFVKK